jgi:hypothetical protein
MFTLILRQKLIVICGAGATFQASDDGYGGIRIAGQVARYFADSKRLYLTVPSLLSNDNARCHRPGDDPTSRGAHPFIAPVFIASAPTSLGRHRLAEGENALVSQSPEAPGEAVPPAHSLKSPNDAGSPP